MAKSLMVKSLKNVLRVAVYGILVKCTGLREPKGNEPHLVDWRTAQTNQPTRFTGRIPTEFGGRRAMSI